MLRLYLSFCCMKTRNNRSKNGVSLESGKITRISAETKELSWKLPKRRDIYILWLQFGVPDDIFAIFIGVTEEYWSLFRCVVLFFLSIHRIIEKIEHFAGKSEKKSQKSMSSHPEPRSNLPKQSKYVPLCGISHILTIVSFHQNK